MDNTIKDEQQKKLDKWAKENRSNETVYTVKIGYNKMSTLDKDIAFKVWGLLSEFFEIAQVGEHRWDPPYFNYKKPISVLLESEKISLWKSNEAAQRSANAFEALTKNNKESKD